MVVVVGVKVEEDVVAAVAMTVSTLLPPCCSRLNASRINGKLDDATG